MVLDEDPIEQSTFRNSAHMRMVNAHANLLLDDQKRPRTMYNDTDDLYFYSDDISSRARMNKYLFSCLAGAS